MNVIKDTRLKKHITDDQMAYHIHVPVCIYRYMEDYRQFNIVQYQIVCNILDINFDIHI